jgi:hypothetical protein
MPSEIERERSAMQGHIESLKNSNIKQTETLQNLREQKKILVAAVRRYKELIANVS